MSRIKALDSQNARDARSFDRHLALLEMLGADITRIGTYGIFASLTVIYFWWFMWALWDSRWQK